MSATERVFVAVHLPAAQRAVLESAIASLRGHGLDRVRWVRVEGIHLTLKFPRRYTCFPSRGCSARDEVCRQGRCPLPTPIGISGRFFPIPSVPV